MRNFLLLIALLIAATSIQARTAPARPVDRDALRAEAVQILAEYIRINPRIALSYRRIPWPSSSC